MPAYRAISQQILIVSAHPDDMEIGMGGTVAKLAESKAIITSVVVTDGGRASNPFAWTEKRMAEVRREEALRAARGLGGEGVLGLNRWRAVFADPKASAPGGVYAEVFLRVPLSSSLISALHRSRGNRGEQPNRRRRP